MAQPIDPAPVFLDARRQFAARFLAGEGLEIGALHQPLATPPQATARYVDRMSVDDLRAEYPELAGWDLTDVDVIDNGELLETIPDESQDFIIAERASSSTARTRSARSAPTWANCGPAASSSTRCPTSGTRSTTSAS